MATPPYIWKQLIQRIRKHMNNGFPLDSYATSDNEILLYIQQASAFGLVGMVWAGAKVLGYMEMPEGYLATLQLPALQQDPASGDWYTALPQPPVSLPLGYSIVRVYSTSAGSQQNQDFFMIKGSRVGRRRNMPMPGGIRCWVDYNNKSILRCEASDNQSLLGIPVFVQMPITRTTDITLPMNLPDDAIDSIFTQVTGWLTKRYQEPKDIINDDLPAGNNNLKE